MSDVDEIMEKARLDFLSEAPYFSSILFSLAPYETTRVPTFAVTEGNLMLYNPDWVRQLHMRENGVRRVASEIWHEVNHVLRNTSTRLLNISHERRNVVSDLAINSSGRGTVWIIGEDWLVPSLFGVPEDLTMEEYHQLLPDVRTLHKRQGKRGACGSGGGKAAAPDLEKELDAKFGRSEDEKEGIRVQTAMAVTTYTGKNAGSIPGWLTEWATMKLTPAKVPWTSVLAGLMRYCTGMIVPGGDVDTSYQRPSVRTYTTEKQDVIIPGDVGQEIVVAFVLDTSGSMNIERNIKPALREARGVLQALGIRDAWWLEVDTRVTAAAKKVTIDDLLRVEIHGRGGTSFVPGFEAVDKLRPRPDLVLYLTDGFGEAPAAPPIRMTTIWVLVDPGAVQPAPWGYKVQVDG